MAIILFVMFNFLLGEEIFFKIIYDTDDREKKSSKTEVIRNEGRFNAHGAAILYHSRIDSEFYRGMYLISFFLFTVFGEYTIKKIEVLEICNIIEYDDLLTGLTSTSLKKK